MAITNPQAVTFSNQFARTRADTFAQTYYATRQMVDEWDASGLAAIIPNDAAETVEDGSAVDGRTPITGANINGFITYARAWLADLEANNNAKLNVLLNISVNPER